MFRVNYVQIISLRSVVKLICRDPRGSLSSKILPSTIAAANTEIMRVMNSPSELKFKSTDKKEARTTSIRRVQGKSSSSPE